jgi:hypothetical protein
MSPKSSQETLGMMLSANTNRLSAFDQLKGRSSKTCRKVAFRDTHDSCNRRLAVNKHVIDKKGFTIPYVCQCPAQGAL